MNIGNTGENTQLMVVDTLPDSHLMRTAILRMPRKQTFCTALSQCVKYGFLDGFFRYSGHYRPQDAKMPESRERPRLVNPASREEVTRPGAMRQRRQSGTGGGVSLCRRRFQPEVESG